MTTDPRATKAHNLAKKNAAAVAEKLARLQKIAEALVADHAEKMAKMNTWDFGTAGSLEHIDHTLADLLGGFEEFAAKRGIK